MLSHNEFLSLFIYDVMIIIMMMMMQKKVPEFKCLKIYKFC